MVPPLSITASETARFISHHCSSLEPGRAAQWKAKYGGLDVSQLKRLKEVEGELAQYKKMYAELAHENYALKELIEKKL